MKRYIYLGIIILLLGFGFFGIVENSKAACCISTNRECRTPLADGSCSDPLALKDPTPLSCTALDALPLVGGICDVIIHPIPSPPPSATISPVTALAPSGPYTLMEGIPGFINAKESTTFPAYIMAIYKFGLWAIGLCAMIMIMIGGYMYLTSAGNTSSTGKAKEVITDAIIGLILALTSYLLLYIINPDLIRLNF